MKSLWLVFWTSCLLLTGVWAEARQWTSIDGQSITGILKGFDGSEVQLEVSGKLYRFPLSRLSAADQAFLEASPDSPDAEGGGSGPMGSWPEIVEAPADMEIEVVKEDREAGEYVYRSPHFEFRTSTRLSKSVVKEFVGIFEATYEVVKALPIGLDPDPPGEGYFLTELYETREAYFQAGGPEGSAGVYMPSENRIMIPLPNLGVKNTGVRWVVERDQSNRTLSHEITHQVTHKWLGRVPIWFAEGIAEYVESAEFSSGRYLMKNMERRVEENVSRYSSGGSFAMVGLERLMTITHPEWNAEIASNTGLYNYPSANLLVTWFLHLDGEGDGAHVFRYLQAINEGTPSEEALKTHLIRGREYAELAEEVRNSLRQAGIRIEYPE